MIFVRLQVYIKKIKFELKCNIKKKNNNIINITKTKVNLTTNRFLNSLNVNMRKNITFVMCSLLLFII